MSETTRSPTALRLMRAVIGIALGALAAVIVIYSNSGGGDAVSRGRWAAEAHCGGCHDVSATAQADRRSGVPSFVLLAQGAPRPAVIEAFLQRPHRAMPPFRLSVEERGNLAAYMASLAPERR